jgi:DNA-binding XRE family transcriptional regulator
MDYRSKRKLSEYEVNKILEYSKAGATKKQLATMFNVSPKTIQNINNNKTYKNIQKFI